MLAYVIVLSWGWAADAVGCIHSTSPQGGQDRAAGGKTGKNAIWQGSGTLDPDTCDPVGQILLPGTCSLTQTPLVADHQMLKIYPILPCVELTKISSDTAKCPQKTNLPWFDEW